MHRSGILTLTFAGLKQGWGVKTAKMGVGENLVIKGDGRLGTTVEFATTTFHLVLVSAAVAELTKSIPVQSLILSSHLFFFFLLLCPVGLSLLNQKTLIRGQTTLVSAS